MYLKINDKTHINTNLIRSIKIDDYDVTVIYIDDKIEDYPNHYPEECNAIKKYVNQVMFVFE